NSATTRTISGNYAGGLIRLNGADRVTIDGRFSGSGNYLTFSNTSTSSSAVFQVISLGTGQGANNVTIRNCNIATGSNSAITYGIHAGSATLGTAADDNDNLSILNNNIIRAYNAIWVRSASTGTGLLDGLTISGNTIGSNNSADYVIFRGIDVQGATSPNISSNVIFNMQTTSTINIAAIDLGQYVTNAVVDRNMIYGIRSTSSSGYGAYGINISSGTGTNNIQIFNNVIYDIMTANYSTTSTTWNAFGIRITGGTNHKIYYNSINFYGSVTSGTSAGMSANLLITAAVSGLDVRNNIFVNNHSFGASGSFAYNVYLGATGITFGTINRNDYFGTTSTNTTFRVGYDGSSARSTLTDWQAYTGQDANSISANPQFQSNTDLRPGLSSPVLNAGTPISGITTDFLGVTRSATAPSMGAYEQGVDATGPTITYTPLTNTNSTSNRTLNNFATITDVSGVNTTSGTAPRIYYKKSTDANTYVGNTSADNGWKWTETTNSSSPFSFIIDYSIIYGGSVSGGDTIQYFIVAQDLYNPPNVGINSGTFASTPTSVNLTSAAFPLTGTIRSYKIVSEPLAGTYTVGLNMFNALTGKNLYYQKFTRTVIKEIIEYQQDFIGDVKKDKIDSRDEISGFKEEAFNKDVIIHNNDSKERISNNIEETTTGIKVENDKNIIKKYVEVTEEYYELMEDGKPYAGERYVLFKENPELKNKLTERGIFDSPDGVFATITDAVNNLTERGVSGAVTFLLVDANYPSETYPLLINSVAGVSATNTITIKPASGVSATISGASASGPIFKIVNTSYVTIDGSNSGTDTRDLSIENTSTTSPQVVLIGSSGTTPITNITLKNCNIRNGSNTSSAVIVSDSSTAGNPGYFNNITIQNNNIRRAYNGIYCNAAVSSGNGSGTLITQNNLNFTGSDAIRLVCIYAQGIDGISVSNNNTGNIYNTSDASNITGIWFASGVTNGSINNNNISILNGTSGGPRGIFVTSNTINCNINIYNNIIDSITTSSSGSSMGIGVSFSTTGVNIYRNRISNVSNTNTGGWNAYGIYLGSSSNTANINVYNNLIYNIYGYGYNLITTDNGYGIILYSGGGYNIYNNSINLTTEQVSASGKPACLMITSSINTPASLDIRNNIFQTNQTVGTCYSVICNASNTVFSNIDYNNYFSNDTIGYIGSNQCPTLSHWRTGTGKDIYSVSGNSGFTSNTNLLPDLNNPNSWVLSGNGIHISTVTDDYAGNPRPSSVSAGAPDIGAYEFSAPSVSPNTFSITPTLGLNTIYVNNRKFVDLNFTSLGSLTQVNVKFFSGTNPPGVNGYPTARFMNGYFEITGSGGGNYRYNITFYYSEPQIGTIIYEKNIRLSKSDNGGTNWYIFWVQGTDSQKYQLDTINNKITVYGLESFSMFTNSDDERPLPIELKSFNYLVNGRDVKLTWQTEKENNNYGFEVERKKGNEPWQKLGFIPGRGNSYNPTSYIFEDKKLNSGKYNYRLKQIDVNGNYNYFELNGTVEIALPTKYELSQNYPNPFNPVTKIDYALPVDGKVNIIIYDMLGREIKKLVNEQQQAGFYTIEFNGSSIASGTYIYRITVEGINGSKFVMSKKMVLVK
ncbi:MAG: hypothetical protein N2490_05705, partial [Ignavibacteria bacterium]|nr:hypothetical protein [Ignavibacteria bacterium]